MEFLRLLGPMIYLIYTLEGDGGSEDAAAFGSSATRRGYMCINGGDGRPTWGRPDRGWG